MAATSGLSASSRHFRRVCTTCERSMDCSRVFNCLNTLMSAPAMNVVSAPIRTIASAAESWQARATASLMPSGTPALRAFTGGLSTVTTATPSRTSYRTSADMARKGITESLGRLSPGSGSGNRAPAVHDDGLPCDVVGGVGRQEHADPLQLTFCTDPGNRRRGLDGRFDERQHRIGEPGMEVSRGN